MPGPDHSAGGLHQEPAPSLLRLLIALTLSPAVSAWEVETCSSHLGGQVVPRPDAPTASKFLQRLFLWGQAPLPPGQIFSLGLSGQVDTNLPWQLICVKYSVRLCGVLGGSQTIGPIPAGVRECLFNQLKIPLENPQGRTELEMQSRNRGMTMGLCVLGTKCSYNPPEGKPTPSGFWKGCLKDLQERVTL